MNKFLVSFTSCFVLISLVKAYDFEDSVYNQILANELEELQWDADNQVVNPRTRRDEEAAIKDDKCRKRRFRSCCDEEYFNSLRENEKPLKKECYKQVTGKEFGDNVFDPFKCDKTEKHKREIGCIAQCVGQKKGLIDELGNLKEEEARKTLKEKMSKLEWLSSKSDELFNKCFALAKEAAARQDPADKDSCNLTAIKLGHCLWREIQLSCPTDRITDEKKCNKIREDIKKNPDTYPHQSHYED